MLAARLLPAHRDGLVHRDLCANICPHFCGNPWLRQPASSLAACC
jgi:hypothetical protein